MWRIVLAVPGAVLATFEAALAEHCETVSQFAEGAHTCRVEGIAFREPDRRALSLALAVATAASGVPALEVTIERLPDRDWLAENRERFAPFRIGRFVVQEPEDETPVPPALITLRIEAATAFGSGRHGSTEGCLRALDMLRGQRIRRPLDL
ncbi:MAG: 50S ribosomal protein L11 methyltransferase, partial [Burkholderiales bacterium]